EDGDQSLNVELVRAGVFPGGVMADMVDGQKALDEELKNPKLAGMRADIDKERREYPHDRVERLVSDADYKRRMQAIHQAEAQEREEKLGIWSDEMKEEREMEGYP